MMRWGPIGIELGSGTLSACQVSRGHVRAWATVQRRGDRSDAQEAERLAGVLRRRGFIGREVVAAVPEHAAMNALLDVPSRSSSAPVEQIARGEMARLHRVDPGAIECAFWDLPAHARQREGLELFGVGCAHEAGEALVESLWSAGYEVAAIDARVCALARACAHMTPAGGLGVIVDLGDTSSTLIVVCDGTIVYERGLEGLGLDRARRTLGGDLGLESEIVEHVVMREGMVESFGDERDEWALLGAARDVLGDWLQDVARECTSAVAYALERYSQEHADTVVLTGSGACVPGIEGALGRILGREVLLWEPHLNADGLGTQGPALACACGLALWGDA